MDFQAPKSINLSGNLNPFGRSIFEVALIIAIIILFNWFVLLPKKNTLNAETSALATLKARADLSTKNLQSLQTLTKGLNSHVPAFAQLDQVLPLSGQPTRLRLLLDKLAQESAVIVGSINVVGKSNQVSAGNEAISAHPFSVDRKVQVLTASLDVVGSFDQVQAFLHKLETNARVMNLTSLEYSSFQGGQVEMRIDLEAYYYGPV